MKTILFFYSVLCAITGCANAERTVYHSDASLPIPSPEALDSVIGLSKPVRVLYVDAHGTTQNKRGFLKKVNDLEYSFEPRRIGDTSKAVPILLSLSQIQRVNLIEDESFDVRDASAMMAMVGLAFVALMLTFSASFGGPFAL